MLCRVWEETLCARLVKGSVRRIRPRRGVERPSTVKIVASVVTAVVTHPARGIRVLPRLVGGTLRRLVKGSVRRIRPRRSVERPSTVKIVASVVTCPVVHGLAHAHTVSCRIHMRTPVVNRAGASLCGRVCPSLSSCTVSVAEAAVSPVCGVDEMGRTPGRMTVMVADGIPAGPMTTMAAIMSVMIVTLPMVIPIAAPVTIASIASPITVPVAAPVAMVPPPVSKQRNTEVRQHVKPREQNIQPPEWMGYIVIQIRVVGRRRIVGHYWRAFLGVIVVHHRWVRRIR